MAITIAKALQDLDILSQAQIVAGRSGTDNIINWTHIVDFPDVTPWVRKGDLLLTTGFAFKDNPESYLELIPALAGKGLAGMIINPDAEFAGIPQSVEILANKLNFPIH